MNQYLKVFVTVAEKKNFSRAAEELHMTQPAVSQHIRTLEEELGTRLLERSNKFVYLNKAGEIVYKHAKEILGLYTKMQSAVDDIKNKAIGPISIGASFTFGEYILPRIIAKLQSRYSQIKPMINIHNSKIITDLVKNHQLDIGIIEGLVKETQLTTEVVFEDKMWVVASYDHHLVQKERDITFFDLENETWILREEGSGTRESVENFFQKYKITPANFFEFGSTQLIKESVEAGLGISLLSSWAIEKDLKHNYLAIVKIKELPFKRNFSIITHSPYHTKALTLFIDTLHEFLLGK